MLPVVAIPADADCCLLAMLLCCGLPLFAVQLCVAMVVAVFCVAFSEELV